MKNIVIIGATSAIAEEVAKLYATQNANLFLAARNQHNLQQIVQDLTVRGAHSITTSAFDALELESHQQLFNQITEHFTQIDICIISHGSLPDQAQCQLNPQHTLQELTINGTSVINMLTLIANHMEQQPSGNITVISSVAGDRGRQSNYVYGSAKAMVSTFLQGLSQRLAKQGIHVLDIKPGFVDTPMTQEFDKGPLWTQPQTVAKIIVKRIESKSNFSYTPFFWFGIMSMIKSIPKFIFDKLKL